jgi:hypothetical protein
MCKYITLIIYLQSVLSLLLVLTDTKLQETNEKKRFYIVSMDEQLEWSALYHTSTLFIFSFSLA